MGNAEKFFDAPNSVQVLAAFRVLAFAVESPEFGDEVARNQAVSSIYAAGVVDVLNDTFKAFVQVHNEQPAAHIATPTSISESMDNSKTILYFAGIILRRVLNFSVDTRDDAFRDFTSIPWVVKTLHILYFTPEASGFEAEIREIFVDSLSIYTKPRLAESAKGKTKNFSDSSWSHLIKEILAYGLSSPHCLTFSAVLLSRLLPLPLPVQVKKGKDVDKKDFVQARNLWSAHLFPLSDQLKKMVKLFMTSTDPEVLKCAKKLVGQLADLSALISEMLTEFFTETLFKDEEKLFEVRNFESLRKSQGRWASRAEAAEGEELLLAGTQKEPWCALTPAETLCLYPTPKHSMHHRSTLEGCVTVQQHVDAAIIQHRCL